mgnify:FL=1
MNKIVEGFMNKSKYEKCAFLVGIFSSIIVIICAFLQILGIWNGAIVICEIFMGISMISQAILQWKRNRGIAIFSLCVAIFIFVVAFIILFIR